ncbi:MAG: hypothetical protein R3C05_09260 [Pirellulaceae bacterium]
MQFYIGRTIDTGEPVYFPLSAMKTHFQGIGGTGSGKTYFVQNCLSGVMLSTAPEGRHVRRRSARRTGHDALVDFVSNPVLCPESVRRRFVYIEPANTDYVMPLNGLLFSSEDDLHYRSGRMSACFMQPHEPSIQNHSRDLRVGSTTAFPRLVYSATRQLLPILDYAGDPAQHNAIIAQMPEAYRLKWADVLAGSVRDHDGGFDSISNRSAVYLSSSNPHSHAGDSVQHF